MARVTMGLSIKARFTGTAPSVAVNKDGKVVCVCNGIYANNIYHDVGQQQQSEIKWKSGISHFVCKGGYPKVAINDSNNKMVMVYTKSKVMYRTGTLGSNVTWSEDEYEVCDGAYPSVSVTDNKVLIVYQVKSKIYYCFGSIESSDTIKWHQKNILLHSSGSYPSVAMQGRLAVVIYNNGSNMMTHIGVVTDTQVTWSEVQDDMKDTRKKSEFTGDYPSVMMLEDNTVVCTLQRGVAAARILLARSGKIARKNDKIEWHEEKPRYYMHGCFTSVAAVTSKDFIEMHSTNGLGGDGIWYVISKVL